MPTKIFVLSLILTAIAAPTLASIKWTVKLKNNSADTVYISSTSSCRNAFTELPSGETYTLKTVQLDFFWLRTNKTYTYYVCDSDSASDPLISELAFNINRFCFIIECTNGIYPQTPSVNKLNIEQPMENSNDWSERIEITYTVPRQ